jgi:AGCS family alanine or glycine:cation symporter
VLYLIILLFDFGSIVGNYYYGEVNIAFFEGEKTADIQKSATKKVMNFFRIGVILMVFVGSVAKLKLIWNCADLFMGLLCITNIYAILHLAKYAFIALDDYVSQKKSGIADPVFSSKIIPDKTGIYAWSDEEKNL